MSCCSSSAESESSGQAEPPNPDAIEVDPTHRYIRYKDVLGKGAFKTVYKAFDEIDGIEVAWNQIKIEDDLQSPEDLDRLYSEVNLLEMVKHENIVKFYYSWIDDGNKTINIITELFTSGNLRQYRRKHKKVDMKAVKGWARQILAGLKYLHSQKPPIIHRDLKCDNIFINGNNGEVKIGDLGLATIMHKDNAQTVIGTPEFMAPELYDEEYNELVDIYSFGMCMLEMVTFEYPYSECTNSAQIFKKVSNGVKPIALSKVKDPEVKAFIEKCLVPAYQRLPATDLLNDPFLRLDGFIEAQYNCSWPSSDTKSFKKDDSGVLHVASSTESQQMLSSSGIDVVPISVNLSAGIGEFGGKCKPLDPNLDAPKNLTPAGSDIDLSMPIIRTCEIHSSSDQHLTALEIEEEWKGNKFRLMMKRSSTGSMSLVLWINGSKDSLKSEFPFYLGTDTTSSVATEIVEYFNLSTEDVHFIADLIDTLLLYLMPGWQSSVAISHKVFACQAIEGSSQFFKVGGISDGSSHNRFEATNSPSSHLSTDFIGGHMQDIQDDISLDQTGFNILQAKAESVCCAASGVVSSESSLCSTFPSLENGRKISSVSGAFMCCTANIIDCNGYEVARDMNKMLPTSDFAMPLNQSNPDLDIQAVTDVSTPSDIFSNDSFISAEGEVDKIEADEELRIELEVIELNYQPVISYLVYKRQQAIAAAMKRAADRKQSLIGMKIFFSSFLTILQLGNIQREDSIETENTEHSTEDLNTCRLCTMWIYHLLRLICIQQSS